jgi:hypothetical protein
MAGILIWPAVHGVNLPHEESGWHRGQPWLLKLRRPLTNYQKEG